MIAPVPGPSSSTGPWRDTSISHAMAAASAGPTASPRRHSWAAPPGARRNLRLSLKLFADMPLTSKIRPALQPCPFGGLDGREASAEPDRRKDNSMTTKPTQSDQLARFSRPACARQYSGLAQCLGCRQRRHGRGGGGQGRRHFQRGGGLGEWLCRWRGDAARGSSCLNPGGDAGDQPAGDSGQRGGLFRRPRRGRSACDGADRDRRGGHQSGRRTRGRRTCWPPRSGRSRPRRRQRARTSSSTRAGDVYLADLAPDDAKLGDETIRRGELYRAAGANGFFAPFLTDLAGIGELSAAVDLPLNILMRKGAPDVAQLKQAGARRVSAGALTARAAYGAAARAMKMVLEKAAMTRSSR